MSSIFLAAAFIDDNDQVVDAANCHDERSRSTGHGTADYYDGQGLFGPSPSAALSSVQQTASSRRHSVVQNASLIQLPPGVHAPKDRGYLVFMYLVLLGATSIPFCALTASPHFLANYYAFFNIEKPKYTTFWRNAAAIISCVYFCLNVPWQAVAVRARSWRPRLVFTSAFLGIAFSTAILPIAPAVAPHASEEAVVIVLLVVTSATSFFAAFAQSSTFGVTASFPSPSSGLKYAVCGPIGIGMSGVIAAVLRVVLVVSIADPTPEDDVVELRVFFAVVAVANAALAVFTHTFFECNAFARFHTREKHELRIGSGIQCNSSALLESHRESLPRETSTAPIHAATSSSRPLWIRILDLMCVNVFVMIGSYAVYPGVAARDVENNRLWGTLVFLAFNVASTAGRVTCAFYTPRDPQAARRILLATSIIRIPLIFAPALVGMYGYGMLGNGYTAAMIVQFFSGATNGFGSACGYGVCNAVVATVDKPAASRLMTVGMATGLALGGLLGLVFCVTAR